MSFLWLFMTLLELASCLTGRDAQRSILESSEAALQGRPQESFLPAPNPDGQTYTCDDLQRLAVANSPLLRQAAADVEAVRGPVQLAIQDPICGMFAQQIKDFAQRKRVAAFIDLRLAKQAYRSVETDLIAIVRADYFAVLAAQKNIQTHQKLVECADQVYKFMTQQLKSGPLAGCEPTQIAVFAVQARTGLIAARNYHALAWKLLAATLGLPNLPLSQVADPVAVERERRMYGTFMDDGFRGSSFLGTGAAGNSMLNR